MLIRAGEETLSGEDEPVPGLLAQTNLTDTPNTFNPATEIGFTPLKVAQVKQDVFDVTGQRVVTVGFVVAVYENSSSIFVTNLATM